MHLNAASLAKQLLVKQQSGPNFVTILMSWYHKHRRDWPWRLLFERHRDPYHVWVSEIMLQQTTIQAVLPAYKRFFESFPGVRDLAAATEEDVRLACRGLGYYRRFRMMHAAAGELVARSAPAPAPIAWPTDFLGWKALPGIGDYTAAAISSIAFGVPKAVVDGNVERVFCRIFDIRAVPDPKLKKLFQSVGDRIVPDTLPGDFNQALMELGQSHCSKQNPTCSECPVALYCQAFANGSQHLAPAPKKPMTFEDVSMHVVLLRMKNRLGLSDRHDKARFLRGSFGFPTAIERDEDDWQWESVGTLSKSAKRQMKRIGSIKHGITKHKIAADVYLLDLDDAPRDVRFMPIEKIEAALVSNLDRKAFHLFLKMEAKKRNKGLGLDEELFLS